MVCIFLEKCIFFRGEMEKMPKAADILKSKYCLSDYEQCARFKVAQLINRSEIPVDLFPTDDEYANNIIRRHNFTTNIEE